MSSASWRPDKSPRPCELDCTNSLSSRVRKDTTKKAIGRSTALKLFSTRAPLIEGHLVSTSCGVWRSSKPLFRDKRKAPVLVPHERQEGVGYSPYPIPR